MLSRLVVSALCVAASAVAQEPKKKTDDRMITVTGWI